MKKFLLLSLAVILVGCGAKDTITEPDVETVVTEQDRKKEQKHFKNFDAFFDSITFLNDAKLEEHHRKAFYFEIPEGIDATGVVLFKPQAFFKQHREEQEKLVEALSIFPRANLLPGMKEVPEEKLPSILQTHNQIISHPMVFHQKKKALERKINVHTGQMSDSVRSEDAQALAYMYDLSGDYTKARKLDGIVCKKFQDRCSRNAKIYISGTVRDEEGGVIDGVIIHVLNYPGRAYRTIDGKYEFELKGQVPQKIRLRATAEGYSDAYKDFYIVTDAPNQTRDRDFVLNKAHGAVAFDTTKPKLANRKVQPKYLQAMSLNLRGSNEFASLRFRGGSFYVTTPLTEYEIPAKSIVRSDGKPYLGPVSVYVYEFDKTSSVDDLLRTDATDELSEYFGSMLKTFGMPFIQFYDAYGSELHVDKSNPIRLRSQIAEMDALRAGTDGVYDPLTDAHMDKLVEDSKVVNDVYPITREYLIDNELVMFPQWWVLDRLKGKWNAEGMRVVDKSGVVETIFYSIDRLTGMLIETDEEENSSAGNTGGVQCTRQGLNECAEYVMDGDGCRALPLVCVRCILPNHNVLVNGQCLRK